MGLDEDYFDEQLYMASMRPVLNKKALFADETSNYKTPVEPNAGDVVTLKFRTGINNVDKVYLVSGAERYRMKKTYSKGEFDFYEISIELTEDIFYYYFEIVAGKVQCVYTKLGPAKELNEYYCFYIIPGYKAPDWAKGAVFYQIYTDRFYNGDKSNDVESREYIYINDGSVKVEDWDKYPAQMGVREFYGGDLQGVIDKMNYLKELGVDVIYFNPLFVSPSNHKYDIQDYDYIDPHFGKIVEDGGECLPEGVYENRNATKYIKRVTDKKNLEASNELFCQLVEKAHSMGMKVILDGVFNHCGSFNKWLDRERLYENAEGYHKGAYISADSPYRSFFKFYKDNEWPYNDKYDGWWGHNTLPKLNYEESDKLYEYIMNIGRKWVSAPYNADGWRLDVAADLGHSSEFNHKFWKDFRKAVKSSNPEAIILAEHYGNPREWLMGGEWDTVMNYDAFMEPLTWFLTGLEKHSDEYREDLRGNADSFFGAMAHHMASFTATSLYTAMNELSNHDHSRFLTRTNRKVGRIDSLGSQAANEGINKGIFREAVTVQMTWPGAPTIYYGDEAGVCGFTDPDNRRTYPWGHEDKELIEFHKAAIAMHKNYPVFSKGSIKFLAGKYNVISYGRFNEECWAVVILNNNEHDEIVDVPVWQIEAVDGEICERVFFTNDVGFDTERISYIVRNGMLTVNMPAISSAVFVKEYRP